MEQNMRSKQHMLFLNLWKELRELSKPTIWVLAIDAVSNVAAEEMN